MLAGSARASLPICRFGAHASRRRVGARALSSAVFPERIPIYQVDAFAATTFKGNPAAVHPLESWLPDDTLLAIAAENNMTETAFIIPRTDDSGDYDLRWFTPTLEVDMCGHATLASGAVVLSVLEPAQEEVGFHTRSGRLVVRSGGTCEVTHCRYYTLDFPLWPVGAAVEPPPKLVHVLGGSKPTTSAPQSDVLFDQIDTDQSNTIERSELKEYLGKVGEIPCEALAAPWPTAAYEVAPMHGAPYYLFEYASEADVQSLAPLFGEMEANVVATAPADPAPPGTPQCDFISRWFGPLSGIPEDHVTGSAHTTLAPYWAERLGKRLMVARQISKRGGTLRIELKGDRVLISGPACFYMEGMVRVDPPDC